MGTRWDLQNHSTLIRMQYDHVPFGQMKGKCGICPPVVREYDFVFAEKGLIDYTRKLHEYGSAMVKYIYIDIYIYIFSEVVQK